MAGQDHNTTPVMDRSVEQAPLREVSSGNQPLRRPVTQQVRRHSPLSPAIVFSVFAIIMVGLLGIGIGATVSSTPPAASTSSSSGTSATTNTSSNTSSSSSTSGASMSMGSTSGSTSTANVPAATLSYGGLPATYVTDPDGAKHFTFTAEQVMWQPVKGSQRILAWTINGMVPGPAIHVVAGDHVRITLINHLPEATALHWHGIQVPSSVDGVPGIEPPVAAGQTHVYDFTVHDIDVGTHWYHSHFDDNTQITGGMYGMFYVAPRPNSTQAQQYADALYKGVQPLGYTGSETQGFHADLEYTEMISETGGYFVVNGKSYPDTQPIQLAHGQTVLLHLVGAGDMIHPMHLHGHTFSIIGEDGHLLPQPLQDDTVDVSPGKTYDIVFYGWAAPGSIYPLHCHILTHLHNPGQPEGEMGGLIVLVEYAK